MHRYVVYRYSGVLLRDVLMYSGLLRPDTAKAQGVKHVQFVGADGMQVKSRILHCIYNIQ